MNYKIKKSNLIFFAILTVAILYYLLRGEFGNILTQLQHTNPIWFSLGICCILLYWIIEARTLHIMLQAYDRHFSYKEVLKLVVTTQFFNGITPFSSGGQPFQIYVLSKRSKLGISSITSASMHNFIMYQIVLVIMGTLAITLKRVFHLFPENASNLQWIALIGFSLNIIIIAALIIIATSPKLTDFMLWVIFKIIYITPLRRKLPSLKIKLTRIVEEFHRDILVLLSDKKMFFHVLLLNACKLMSFYTVAFFICRSVGLDSISIYQAVIASAYVMLITSVVPLPGASGGAEIGFLLFFSSFIIGPQATAIMLLWRFTTYYIGLIAGLATFYFGYPSPTTKYLIGEK